MTGRSPGDPTTGRRGLRRPRATEEGEDSWATPGVLSPTVVVLPRTVRVPTGMERLQPQAGQGEVLPTMWGQSYREAWSLALPCVPHLGSHILVGVLGCCCLWANQVAVALKH